MSLGFDALNMDLAGGIGERDERSEPSSLYFLILLRELMLMLSCFSEMLDVGKKTRDL